MKRLWITLAVVALGAIAALPATAGKPVCNPLDPAYTPDHAACKTDDSTTTTTLPGPTETVDCVFNVDGVLMSWHGHVDDDRQCIWNVEDPGDTFRFQIQSGPDDPVTEVKLPHLIVNADIVFPSNKCFDAWQRSPQNLPFPSDGDDLWTFSPEDNYCGAGPYMLTISVQALKSGSVDLVMTQNP